MLSKWKWIQKAYENEGLYESAAITKQLEDLLKKIYGSTITERWANDYKLLESLSLDSIHRVQSARPYCIGCVRSEYRCEFCSLASRDFSCSEGKSFYQKFLKVQGWEIENRTVDIEMPC